MTLKTEKTGSCGKRDEEEDDGRLAERESGTVTGKGGGEGPTGLCDGNWGSEHGSEVFGTTLEALCHLGVAEGFHVCMAQCAWGHLYVWGRYLQGPQWVGDSWCSSRVEISECGVPCLCVGSVCKGSHVHVGSPMCMDSGVCLCDGHVWDLVCM